MSVKSERKRKAYEEKKNTPAPVVSILPHYTAAKLLTLLNSDDPSVESNAYGTAKQVVLSDEIGYFRYSDKSGGTVTFVAETWEPDYKETPIFTASIVVTDEMRQSKCGAPDCTSDHDWTQLTYKCGCPQHHEGERYAISPRVESCNTTECDGKHVHLYAFCQVCFDLDIEGSKDPKDATANAIDLLLR